MKYYVIAGEASGDLHASNMMKALKLEDEHATYRVWGGDLMAAAGGEVVKHYRDLAFMGFAEVVANLRTIFRNIAFCKKDILAYEPDALILVDYPGFNLRIARWARQQGLRVIYYISPQIWAWHQSRVKKIQRDVDLMLVILPFEEAFYKKHGVSVSYVGHPLLDVVSDYEAAALDMPKTDKPIVALLPGSRMQEIGRVLPEMLRAVPHFPEHQFVVGAAPSADAAWYEEALRAAGLQDRVNLVWGQTYDLLSHAQAALVTSGTATLETALFELPQVVCYKGGQLSYLIARQLIKTRFISLVNLIADKAIVQELIQAELNEEKLTESLSALFDADKRQQMIADYKQLKELLGGSGASQRAAEEISRFLSN